MSLKVRLLLGAAAPFALAMPAMAQVSIATATTTPVSTATASNGAPANVEITSAGSITLATTAGSTGVTINSANTLTNNGAISITNANNATGVLINPGLTTGYTGSGAISLVEDYTRTDTDADGDLDGELATGSGRTGLLLQSGGTMTGNILTTGTVSIEGNQSAGISLQSILNGSLTQDGGVTVLGSGGFGVDIREDVTGNVTLGGTTVVTGQGSTGVRVLGDVAGEFMIDGSVLTTGYTSTSLTNYADPDFLQSGQPTIEQRLDADDLYQGSSAVVVRGNLTRGLLLNGAAVGTTDPTDTVKDVIQDFNENRSTASITSLGSAPALLLQPLDGAAGANINFGLVRESVQDTLDDDKDNNTTEVIGVFDYQYGLINRGSIRADGQNVGLNGLNISATGLRIAGSADGAYTTTVQGGVFNGGTISARALEADATGVSIGRGAITPQLVNTGSITAQVLTEDADDAIGVLIGAGANVASVTNNGNVAASTRGYEGDAVAFRDLSGTVTSFTNTSRLVAGHVDDDTSDTITDGTGLNLALDLSANTSGVVLTQTDTVDNARMFGDIRLGSGSDRFDLLSGEVFGDVAFSSGSDTLNVASAKLFGDTAFGGAGATVNLSNSSVVEGALTLGNAVSQISLTSGAVYEGDVTRGTGGSLDITVNNATFNNSATPSLGVNSMNLSNGANVGVVVSNARITNGNPIFDVSGTANVAANTKFTPIFNEVKRTPFTLRVIEAGTLNLGGPAAAMIGGESPYLYDVSLQSPAGQNALDLVLRVKTADELTLNDRSASAYNAVLDFLVADAEVGKAVTAVADAKTFRTTWADLLPAQDAATVQVLAANAGSAFGAAAHRLDLITEKPEGPGGAWVEEFGVYRDTDLSDEALGVSGGGFGVAAGLDLLGGRNSVLGAFLSLESVELEEKGRSFSPLRVANTSVGAYGGWKSGQLSVTGAASAGFTDFNSDRKVNTGDFTDQTSASWSGNTATAAVRAGYRFPLGAFDLKPYAGVDYTLVKQEGYTETSLQGTGIALTASDAEHSLATAGYGAEISANFGMGGEFQFRPRATVGYRSILSWDAQGADYKFAGGPTSFTLADGLDPEDAITAGIGFNVSSQFLNVKVGYDTEISEQATTHYGSLTLRLSFW